MQFEFQSLNLSPDLVKKNSPHVGNEKWIGGRGHKRLLDGGFNLVTKTEHAVRQAKASRNEIILGKEFTPCWK